MTGYERTMHEAYIPDIVRSLRSIAESLKKLVDIHEVIISDPEDETEHITEAYPGAGYGYIPRKKD
jgi:hypothetical protein